MNPTETVQLVRLVYAVCPQQSIDEHTPAAWSVLLEDLRLADCTTAVQALGRRQSFIAPAEIRAEVRKLRNDRLERAGPATPPPGVADNPRRYLAWLRATEHAIADGRPAPAAVEAPRRDMRALASAFRDVP